jgi:hypothetical protein
MAVTTNFSDLQAINNAFDQSHSISLAGIPLDCLAGEFVATGFPKDAWEFEHRDSQRAAISNRTPFVSPVRQKWVVSHLLCRGIVLDASRCGTRYRHLVSASCSERWLQWRMQT